MRLRCDCRLREDFPYIDQGGSAALRRRRGPPAAPMPGMRPFGPFRARRGRPAAPLGPAVATSVATFTDIRASRRTLTAAVTCGGTQRPRPAHRWHGRGQGFESPQLHPESPQVNGVQGHLLAGPRHRGRRRKSAKSQRSSHGACPRWSPTGACRCRGWSRSAGAPWPRRRR
jgi:hypothetical protein